MSSRLLLCALASVVLLSSCSKKLTPPPPPRVTSKSLNIEEIEFDYLEGKAKMEVTTEKRKSEFKAHIRMRKDSVIWMTFTVVGLQGGKALINRDSMTIVNNAEKQYYVFDYAELTKRFNFAINFDVIQAAFLGNLIMELSDTDQVSESENNYLVQQQQGTVLVRNLVNMASHKIESIEMTESNSANTMSLQYSNFQPLGVKLLPYNGSVALSYKTAASQINTTILFEYSKVDIGTKELKFTFNIPKKYDRR
jgi:outer membrane lipoprotein-sorting protein